MIFFRTWEELSHRFNLSIESGIIFSDYCKDMIFIHKDGTKFTDKALLLQHSVHGHDDWIEAEHINFYPWENIIGFQNIQGTKTFEDFSKPEIDTWVLRDGVLGIRGRPSDFYI
jgi:hypothetical protein